MVLLIQCPDQPGIVAKISDFIFKRNGNITDSSQHSTIGEEGSREEETFFMRVEFHLVGEDTGLESLKQAFAPLMEELRATWNLHSSEVLPRMALAVSKFDHCLVDLLYRVHSGEIRAEIPFIISNHIDVQSIAATYDIPFVHLPVTQETKTDQERQLIETIIAHSDFLVLARYMQILSQDFLDQYAKPVINIHHSFLPSFKGANPYRQAFERGVKLIGATAHYATTDLDEGPIIEQVVDRVTHRDTVESLKSKGRSLEQQALGRAVKAHIEHRVIRWGNKTIVFD
jgi:formyltetrahydrofolate deformylase